MKEAPSAELTGPETPTQEDSAVNTNDEPMEQEEAEPLIQEGNVSQVKGFSTNHQKV